MSDLFKAAPEGYVYVCHACGKRSPTRAPSRGSQRWWDESCMLNCSLEREADLVLRDGRVVEIRARD